MGFDTSRLTAWKIQRRKEECAIDKTLEKTARKKALTRNRPVRGKTRIIVKEHFSQQGKTNGRTTDRCSHGKGKADHALKSADRRKRLNIEKDPCYTLSASRYCKHGLVIKEDN